MKFKEGDKVQFIENNELIIGTIKRVNNDVGWVDLKVSDLSWFFRKLEDVVKVKEPELIAVPRFAADCATAGMFTRPLFLYVLKCQLAFDPDLKNEIRDAWKASKVKEVSK